MEPSVCLARHPTVRMPCPPPGAALTKAPNLTSSGRRGPRLASVLPSSPRVPPDPARVRPPPGAPALTKAPNLTTSGTERLPSSPPYQNGPNSRLGTTVAYRIIDYDDDKSEIWAPHTLALSHPPRAWLLPYHIKSPHMHIHSYKRFLNINHHTRHLTKME